MGSTRPVVRPLRRVLARAAFAVAVLAVVVSVVADTPAGADAVDISQHRQAWCNFSANSIDVPGHANPYILLGHNGSNEEVGTAIRWRCHFDVYSAGGVGRGQILAVVVTFAGGVTVTMSQQANLQGDNYRTMGYNTTYFAEGANEGEGMLYRCICDNNPVDLDSSAQTADGRLLVEHVQLQFGFVDDNGDAQVQHTVVGSNCYPEGSPVDCPTSVQGELLGGLDWSRQDGDRHSDTPDMPSYPGWPLTWPAGQGPGEADTVPPPVVTCRVVQSPGAGKWPRLSLQAVIHNHHADAVDDPGSWHLPWKDAIDDLQGRYVSTDIPDNVQLPAGGWKIEYTTKRTITVTGAVGRSPVVSQNGLWKRLLNGGREYWNWVASHTPSYQGPDIPDAPPVVQFYTHDDIYGFPEYHGDDGQLWVSAETHCIVAVDPTDPTTINNPVHIDPTGSSPGLPCDTADAGCPGGDSNWPGPGPTTPTSGPTPETGSCKLPTGWNLANPSAWTSWLACSVVGGIIKAFAGLVEALLKMLKDLFIPKRSFHDLWAGIYDSATTSGPLVLMNGMRDMIASFGSGWESGGCDAMPDFSWAQDGSARIPCHPADSTTWTVLYGGIEIAIFLGLIREVYDLLWGGFGSEGDG